MAEDWRTPDAEALFDAILQPRGPRRGGALLPRPVHAQRAARHGPALGGRPAARQRACTTPRSRADRRQHGDDHPDRLVAQPRRGRLPRDARQARRGSRDGTTPTRPRRAMTRPPAPGGPEQGPPRRADAAPAPRRRPRLRGARPEPRRARPELRPRHPVRAHERRHRVRRRRRRRPRHHRRRPADRDRRRAAADPRRSATAAAGSRPPSRTTRRTRPSRTSPACASRPPTRTPPAASSRSAASPVDVIPISGAVEVAPRLGLAEAIVDLVSTGSTLVMNGLRQIGDVLASEAILVANPTADRERAAELAAIDTMLSAVIAARGRKYLMMNAPADAARPSSRPSCRPSSRRRSSRSPTRA